MEIRPRRSVLYMPASNQRAMEKTRTLPVDAVVFDLEDSVGVNNKPLAREQCITAIQAGGYGSRELIVRVNGSATMWWKDDVTAVAHSGADALCLPKVETLSEVDAIVTLLNDVGAPNSLDIWVMIETPLGVINLDKIAAHTRVNVVVMGTTDLAKELRVPHTLDRMGLLASLGHCVLIARAYNTDILDGVYLNLNDPEGFTAVCQQGRNLGFDGKTLIHPSQIASANQCFSPSDHDVIWAKKIIDAWKLAECEGSGVVLVDGQLVESMHIDEAKRTLMIAQVI